MPTREEMERLQDFVRYRATLPGASIDPALRQEIACGLIVQAVVRRHAWVGARGIGSDAIIRRMSDAVHADTLATLGVDLRQFPLYGPRSALNTQGIPG